MKFLASALLFGLAAANSRLLARQSTTGLGIKGVTTDESEICASGTYAKVITQDQSNATLIFDSFKAVFDPNDSKAARELSCTVTFSIDFPPKKCSIATIETIYRGYAQVNAEGVTAEIAPTYELQGGKLSGSLKATKFDASSNPDILRSDIQTANVTVGDASQQTLRFTTRTRLRVNVGSQTVTGVVYLDSIDLSVRNLKSC